MNHTSFLCLSVAILFFSCKKDNSPQKNGITEVYVAGTDQGMMAIWNNNKQLLFNEQGGYGTVGNIYGVTVKDTNVYAAGISSSTAVYMKNGVQTNLSDPLGSAAARSIYFSGNDMYVAGYQQKPADVLEVGYWKNGLFSALTKGAYGDCYDIAVAGNKVHAVGHINNEAVYWVDGDSTVLTRDFFSSAKAIKIIGSDVYIAGAASINSMYWKNGVRHELEGDYTYAEDIEVSGNDVYVAGYVLNDTKPFAAYWKNGKKFELGSGYATGIQIVDGDVYICGYLNIDNVPTAVYWKNDVRNKLATSVSPGLPVITTGIAVVKK